MKKNGFTLIELLAVIVIIGLILVITSKDILGVIENSKMKATKYDVAGIFDDLSTQIHSLEIENKDYAGTYTVKDGKILEENNFDLKMKSNYNGIITINDDKEITAALGDNRYCVNKGINTYDVYPNQFDDKSCKVSSSNKCFHVKNGVLEWYGERKDQYGYPIVGYCEVEELNIPGYVRGEKIKEIGSWVFYGLGIQTLELPNTLEKIGSMAFMSNSLTELVVPTSVTYIGNRAFNDNLIEGDSAYVYQRNSDGSINDKILVSFGNRNADNCIIPDTVTAISDYLFAGGNLEVLTIPDSVTIIGEEAFSYNNLTDIIIPNSVKTIGNGAFSYNNLSTVTIPNFLTNISDNVFYNNNLSTVSIPNSVKTIGKGAFSYNSLLNIELSDSLLEIGENAFFQNNLSTVEIPNTVVSIGQSAFENNNLSTVSIPNSVINIGMSAFSDNNLSSLFISNSLATIEPYLFYNNSLTSVTIPNSVTSIGQKAFGKNSLTSVTIPNSVTKVEEKAFYQNSLTNVTLSVNLKELGINAFKKNYLVGNDAFFYKYNPDGTVDNTVVTSYGGNSDDVIVPEGVKRISNLSNGDGVFSDLNIISITLPKSLEYIGSYAFCYNYLESLTIPSSVLYIDEFAFSDNRYLKSVIFETGTKIGENAIKSGAFAYTNISKVIYPSLKNQIWSDVFKIGREQIFSTGILKDRYNNDKVEVVYE
ncbi:MAG: leucine-rich repeat domain-containing protein [Bacilli bacterium]|nr:leucine-rich repeat domain-containing protein [Bacilli bacterium]